MRRSCRSTAGQAIAFAPAMRPSSAASCSSGDGPRRRPARRSARRRTGSVAGRPRGRPRASSARPVDSRPSPASWGAVRPRPAPARSALSCAVPSGRASAAGYPPSRLRVDHLHAKPQVELARRGRAGDALDLGIGGTVPTSSNGLKNATRTPSRCIAWPSSSAMTPVPMTARLSGSSGELEHVVARQHLVADGVERRRHERLAAGRRRRPRAPRLADGRRPRAWSDRGTGRDRQTLSFRDRLRAASP